MIYPAFYTSTVFGGVFNPYWGGFGHFNLPYAGAGFFWPGYTFPFNLQTPELYARKAGFVG